MFNNPNKIQNRKNRNKEKINKKKREIINPYSTHETLSQTLMLVLIQKQTQTMCKKKHKINLYLEATSIIS